MFPAQTEPISTGIVRDNVRFMRIDRDRKRQCVHGCGTRIGENRDFSVFPSSCEGHSHIYKSLVLQLNARRTISASSLHDYSLIGKLLRRSLDLK